MARTLFKRHRRNFEEVASEETAETSETTTEESAPDSQSQFVQLLTDMGLSAEQAEAVFQMAQDLVNAGGGEQPQKTEASRLRREREFQRARRERQLSRERRFRREERMPQSRRELSREGRRGSEGRTDLSANVIRRQRATIVELRKQLAQMGAAPAAQKLSRAPQGRNAQVAIPQDGDAKSRVFAALKNWL
jgi:type II secretory pathway component HofQ